MILTKLSEIRKEARDALNNKWAFGAEITLLFFVVSGLIQSSSHYVLFLPLLLLPIINYGYSFSMLKISRKEGVDFETLFIGFSKRFWTIFFAYLIMIVRILLWSLLLIIPGIIAAYSYSQTFFILADKDVSAIDAIKESTEIMKGNKWRFFLLSCSFIGWGILCIFTLFIGFLWLTPYSTISSAKFYDLIRAKKNTENTL